jgi:general secretion pathway protein D
VELVEERDSSTEPRTFDSSPENKSQLTTSAKRSNTSSVGDSNIDSEKSSVAASTAEDIDYEKPFNFQGRDIELTQFIKAISKEARRNYVIGASLKGKKLSLLRESPLTVGDALRLLDTVLLLNGFTTVPLGSNTWKIIPAKDAKQTTIPLVTNPGNAQSDALVTQLLRLKHVAAEDMQSLLTQFISKDGVMKAVEGSNSLVVIDAHSNLLRLSELVEQIDVPAVDQELTIIPVEHADAKDIAEKINEILGEDEAKNGGAVRSTTGTRSVRGITRSRNLNNQSQNSTSSRRALPLKIIPDERTNSLIVVADESMTLRVQALAEQLDSEVDRSSGRFWVYRLQHADAEDLSEILNNLISGAESSDSNSSGTQGSSISRSRASQSSANAGNQRAQLARVLQRSRNLLRGNRTAAAEQEDGGRVTLEGEVSIAPDPSTNSLIVNASRSDFHRIKEVVQALDIKRRQVLVEATLLEVTLSEDEGLGVELQGSTAVGDDAGLVGQTNFGGLSNLFTNPAALTDLTIAAASSGTLTLPGGISIPSQAILITAVSRHSNVNVLSSPTILATDNEEAEIIVGENVPFVTSTSTDSSNIGNTFNQIERQDVGITLRITPQISTGDFLNLKIFVEISNVVAGTRNDSNGPTTTIRTTETTVEVRDQQMIVTGGLIADAVTQSTRGVPLLQDIPVLGQYFKREDENIRRTNLLIFITPRIISDQFDARDETRSRAGKLREKTIDLEDTIGRENVLDNERIDNVVEQFEDDTTPPPSTIRPDVSVRGKESEAMRRTQRRLQELQVKTKPSKDTASNARDLSDEEVIDISVTPKLPGTEDVKSKQIVRTARLSQSTPDAGKEEDSLSKATTGDMPRELDGGSRSFVVLRAIGNSHGGKKLPFDFAIDKSTVGVSVLGGLGQEGAFFSVGSRYKYTAQGDNPENSVSFVCLGVYGSPREAGVVHPELSNDTSWHTLSPEQSLALGTRTWRRE